MLAYTSVNPKIQHLPPNTESVSIYATAFNCSAWCDQRVKLLDIYDAYVLPGKRPYKLAMVQPLHPNAYAFPVPVDCLRGVMFQISVELS